MKLRYIFAAVLLLAGISLAQTVPSPGVRGAAAKEQQSALFFNYMYLRSNFPGETLKNYAFGGATQANMMFKEHLGVAADFSLAKCSWCGQTDHSSTEWSFLVGPRFQFGSGKNKFGATPWVGFAKLTYENPPKYPNVHESGFAYGAGGDWNLRLSKRFTYRVIGGDYLRMPYNAGGPYGANWFRLTTGLGIKF
jgi:hypothetical protein